MVVAYVILLILNVALGVLPLFYSRRQLSTVMFSVGALGTSAWAGSIFLMWYTPNVMLWGRVIFAGPIIAAYCFTYYCALYPKPLVQVTSKRLLLSALFPLFLLSSVPTHFIVQARDIHRHATYGPGHVLLSIYIFGALIAMVGFSIRAVWMNKGVDKTRVKYSLSGLCLTGFCASVTNVLLPALGNNNFTIYGPLFTVFFIGSNLVAMLKYRLLDVEIIIRKSVPYFLLIGVVSLTFSSAVFRSSEIFETHFGANQIFSIFLASSVVIFLYPNLREQLDHFTEKIFFRSHFDYRGILRDVGLQLNQASQIKDIATLLFEASMLAQKPVNLAVYFFQESGILERCNATEGSDPFPPDISRDSEIHELAVRCAEITFTEELVFGQANQDDVMLHAELISLGVFLVVPVVAEGTCRGLMLLGEKRSEEAYSGADINFLDTLRNLASVALQNATHYQSVQQNIQDVDALNHFMLSLASTFEVNEILKALVLLLEKIFHFQMVVVYGVPHRQQGLYGHGTTSRHAVVEYDPSVTIPLEHQHHVLWEEELGRQVKGGIPMDDLEFPLGQYLALRDLEGQALSPELIKSSPDATVQEFLERVKTYFDVQELVTIPFVSGEKFYGIAIGMFRDLPVDLSRRLSFLQMLGQEVAIALNNAEMVRQVSDMRDYNAEILKNMSSGVIVLDERLCITSFNQRASEILGVNEATVLGREVSTLYPFHEGMRALEVTKRRGRGTVLEFQVTGHATTHSLVTGLIRIRGEEGVIGILSDITELKLLRKDVEQANKLSSLGTMAAGIAHEIKNPLVAIKTMTQLLPEKWEDETYRAKYNELVGPQVDRINELCQSLLRLGKPKKAKLEEVEMVSVLEEVLGLLRMSGGKIELKVNANVDRGRVLADRSQMLQIVLNLTMNALDATAERKDEPVRPVILGLHRGDEGEVILTVEDHGVGMTVQQQEKAFDPFFSTKAGGTGLGLTIVHRIVEDHRGKIRIKSKWGVGSIFTVTLPALETIQDAVALG